MTSFNIKTFFLHCRSGIVIGEANDYHAASFVMVTSIFSEFHHVSTVRHARRRSCEVLSESNWTFYLVCERQDNRHIPWISLSGTDIVLLLFCLIVALYGPAIVNCANFSLLLFYFSSIAEHFQSLSYDFLRCNFWSTLISEHCQAPKVKTIVKIGGEVTEEEKEKAGEHNVSVLSYQDLYAEGEAHPSPHNPPQPEDIATICYTSGTTGMCKHLSLLPLCNNYRGQLSDFLIDCIPSWLKNV